MSMGCNICVRPNSSEDVIRDAYSLMYGTNGVLAGFR